jgi:hypothetical protein
MTQEKLTKGHNLLLMFIFALFLNFLLHFYLVENIMMNRE